MNQQTVDCAAVIGASGGQGGAIASELVRHGMTVRGLNRSGGHVPDGVVPLAANLGDFASLNAALEGVSHVVVTVPLCYDAATVELWMNNLAEAARSAGVRRIVVNTNTRLPEASTSVAGFETRRSAERILSDSGVPVVVVRPTVYLNNLLAPPVAAGIVNEGVLRYPVAEGTLVGWMSHTCLGEAVAAAMLGAQDGEVINIGGADLVGSELADYFSTALSRPVRYEPLDPSSFEQGLAQAIGAETARGVAGLYHWIGANPGTELMTGGTTGLKQLGMPAESVMDWINRQSW